MLNINGCVFCGELERGHGQRYDSMHPPTRRAYLAPTNELRKIRLKMRRKHNL